MKLIKSLGYYRWVCRQQVFFRRPIGFLVATTCRNAQRQADGVGARRPCARLISGRRLDASGINTRATCLHRRPKSCGGRRQRHKPTLMARNSLTCTSRWPVVRCSIGGLSCWKHAPGLHRGLSGLRGDRLQARFAYAKTPQVMRSQHRGCVQPGDLNEPA
jgi:hypothetical protein